MVNKIKKIIIFFSKPLIIFSLIIVICFWSIVNSNGQVNRDGLFYIELANLTKLNVKDEETEKILVADYKLDKSFKNNDLGVHIYRKVVND